jgi:hypothetical protein
MALWCPAGPGSNRGVLARTGGPAFRARCEGWGVCRHYRMKIPALSLQKPERQGQGTLGSKIRRKGWASPPTCAPYSESRSMKSSSPSRIELLQGDERSFLARRIPAPHGPELDGRDAGPPSIWESGPWCGGWVSCRLEEQRQRPRTGVSAPHKFGQTGGEYGLPRASASDDLAYWQGVLSLFAHQVGHYKIELLPLSNHSFV